MVWGYAHLSPAGPGAHISVFNLLLGVGVSLLLALFPVEYHLLLVSACAAYEYWRRLTRGKPTPWRRSAMVPSIVSLGSGEITPYIYMIFEALL